MAGAPLGLPDGFVVRLHDDVVVQGSEVRRGDQVVRIAARGLALLDGREVCVDSRSSAVLAARLLDLDLVTPVLGAAPADLSDLTVVVPVLDRASGVDRLLSALAEHVHCVVVDDGSSDPGALAAVVHRYGGELVRLDRTTGPSVARNTGLRHVRTPFVAFVDSDVELDPEALKQLVGHLTDPGLAAVAPRVLTRGGGCWFERYEEASGSLDLGPVPATVRPATFIPYVPTACLVARVEALGLGFDPLMHSGEDVDLVWRLQADGWRIRHAAEVQVWHVGRSTVRSWLGRKVFYGTSAADLARRHGDRVAPAILIPTAAASGAAVLVQRPWSLVLAAVLGRRALASTRTRPASVAVSTARQITRLSLRTWWPAAVLLALVSHRARRALTVMAVADGLAAQAQAETTLDPLRYLAARRLDDAAYGAGVWWGAARARSVACLLPRWIRSTS